MPAISGTLTDNKFDLEHNAAASVGDFPFDGFFITDQVADILLTVSQTSGQIRGSRLTKITGSRLIRITGSKWGVIRGTT